jgi:hypothetical protein
VRQLFRPDAIPDPVRDIIVSLRFTGAIAAPWRFGEGAVVPRHLKRWRDRGCLANRFGDGFTISAFRVLHLRSPGPRPLAW